MPSEVTREPRVGAAAVSGGRMTVRRSGPSRTPTRAIVPEPNSSADAAALTTSRRSTQKLLPTTIRTGVRMPALPAPSTHTENLRRPGRRSRPKANRRSSKQAAPAISPRSRGPNPPRLLVSATPRVAPVRRLRGGSVRAKRGPKQPGRLESMTVRVAAARRLRDSSVRANRGTTRPGPLEPATVGVPLVRLTAHRLVQGHRASNRPAPPALTTPTCAATRRWVTSRH